VPVNTASGTPEHGGAGHSEPREGPAGGGS
jgi:hypothetical protein